MKTLINSLSSWSDSVFNLKACSLLDGFLRLDCLWQPEKFNHGLVRLLLWESNTPPAFGTENKCEERKMGATHELFWHISFVSAFLTDQTILYRLGTKCWLPRLKYKTIDNLKLRHRHTHSPRLLRTCRYKTRQCDRAALSNHRKFQYLGTEDKSA